jgi:hypothetical protein
MVIMKEIQIINGLLIKTRKDGNFILAIISGYYPSFKSALMHYYGPWYLINKNGLPENTALLVTEKNRCNIDCVWKKNDLTSYDVVLNSNHKTIISSEEVLSSEWMKYA